MYIKKINGNKIQKVSFSGANGQPVPSYSAPASRQHDLNLTIWLMHAMPIDSIGSVSSVTHCTFSLHA